MKENWTYKKVKEVCKKASSNIVLNKIEDNTGDFPLYGASGFVKGVDFYHRDEPYIGIVKDGSGVGRVDVYPAKSSLVGTMQYILPQKECSLKYLCYALQGLNLSQFVNGAAIPHIYFRDYGECTIPVPPIETQSRIVSELDLLQSIIDKQKAQLKELDNLAQAVFYDMFGDPVENDKGWEVKKLGEFCRIGTGSTPNRERKEYYGGHIPWVKTTEVCNCLINNTEEYLTQLGLDNSNCSLYPPDTILMAMYGQGKTRGQIAILGITATTNQACAAIQYDSNVVDKTFLFQQLLLLYDNIRSLARGGNQANLNLNLVRGIQVIVPLLSQQQSFAAKIESIEKQKAAINQSIAETQRLFDYTMDKYFG